MAISRRVFDDFQGSTDAVKAIVRIISKYGKLDSFMKYKMAKVTE
jgi:hypothetical protein